MLKILGIQFQFSKTPNSPPKLSGISRISSDLWILRFIQFLDVFWYLDDSNSSLGSLAMVLTPQLYASIIPWSEILHLSKIYISILIRLPFVTFLLFMRAHYHFKRSSFLILHYLWKDFLSQVQDSANSVQRLKSKRSFREIFRNSVVLAKFDGKILISRWNVKLYYELLMKHFS